MMIVIFLFSDQPASQLPDFGWADRLDQEKRACDWLRNSRFIVLAGLEFSKDKRWVAWLLALLYAMTDEFHQSFVSGRHPTLWDVGLFDNLGALISLWIVSRYRKQKRPDPFHPIVR